MDDKSLYWTSFLFGIAKLKKFVCLFSESTVTGMCHIHVIFYINYFLTVLTFVPLRLEIGMDRNWIWRWAKFDHIFTLISHFLLQNWQYSVVSNKQMCFSLFRNEEISLKSNLTYLQWIYSLRRLEKVTLSRIYKHKIEEETGYRMMEIIT
jgi:hypothetical protein